MLTEIIAKQGTPPYPLNEEIKTESNIEIQKYKGIAIMEEHDDKGYSTEYGFYDAKHWCRFGVDVYMTKDANGWQGMVECGESHVCLFDQPTKENVENWILRRLGVMDVSFEELFGE